MNTHPSYTLGSRPQTGRYPRAGGAVARHLCRRIILTDVAFIVAMSCLTGIAYHLATYGKPGNIILFMQVGVLAASQAAHRAIQVWNVTLICLLMVGGSGSTSR